MRLRAHDAIPAEPVAVGNTIPDVMPLLGIPFWGIPVLIAVAGAVVVITRNPFWMLASIVGGVFLTRSLLALNHNKPRELWASFRSGSMFADRTVFGGESRDVSMPRGEMTGPR